MDDNAVLSLFICAILFLTLSIYVNHTERLALQLKHDVRKSLVDAGHDFHGQFERLSEGIDQLKTELENKQRVLDEYLKQKESKESLKLKALEENLHNIVISLRKPTDCTDIDVNHGSGIYTIYPIGIGSFRVYCDLEYNNTKRGWTVFQHRETGEEDFNRGWIDYEYGFGNLQKEFWLGNSKLHALTDQGRYEMVILKEDFYNNKTLSRYDFFKIDDRTSKYKLSIGEYSGTAGNTLEDNNVPFSTKDQKNDNSHKLDCARSMKGAWWFTKSNCFESLNAQYVKNVSQINDWNNHISMLFKQTTMMIRRVI